jgi:DnaJ-class molecular chaperone
MGPLEILGLSPGSSLDDAKSHWRQLVQQHHPDHTATEDTQKFQEIQAAYEAIKADPSILDGKKASTINFLRVDVDISIEDFYFYREIPVRISRQVFCGHCAGTGAEARESGVCSLCGGTGQITGNVLKLLGRDSTCPNCSGTGVPEQNRCTMCRGSKFVTDSSLRKIRFSLEDYRKKIVTIKSAGHQLTGSAFGNVFIKLNIEPDNVISIEDDYFKTHYKILPVQRIIGDDAEITVFGRTLKFRIEKNASETMIEDRVSPGVAQKVRILFIEMPPALTDETVGLYRKILSVEKNSTKI